MSVENQPNINAAGFAAGIYNEFFKHLRGPANETPKAVRKAFDGLYEKVSGFVESISLDLDDKFIDGIDCAHKRRTEMSKIKYPQTLLTVPRNDDPSQYWASPMEKIGIFSAGTEVGVYQFVEVKTIQVNVTLVGVGETKKA